MSTPKTTTVVTFGLLTGLGVVSFMLPDALSIPSATAVAPPDVLRMSAVVRDFKEWDDVGGHIDFDAFSRDSIWPACGYGQYSGAVANTLGADGRPVFTGAGFKVDTPWEDSSGRPICHALYNASLGDVPGVQGCSNNGGIDSAASFNQWYRDEPGVNISQAIVIEFIRQPDGTYVFDDKDDPLYSGEGGFFPIDDKLFGNPPIRSGVDHNYHFTLEMHARFIYSAADNPVFSFLGDDDVWVFINGQKVIDLGGVHTELEQVVELSRLGLTDGEYYDLDLFYAERNRTGSNFRAKTNLSLENRIKPTVSAIYD